MAHMWLICSVHDNKHSIHGAVKDGKAISYSMILNGYSIPFPYNIQYNPYMDNMMIYGHVYIYI